MEGTVTVKLSVNVIVDGGVGTPAADCSSQIIGQGLLCSSGAAREEEGIEEEKMNGE